MSDISETPRENDGAADEAVPVHEMETGNETPLAEGGDSGDAEVSIPLEVERETHAEEEEAVVEPGAVVTEPAATKPAVSRRLLAVLGAPIAHSISPVVQRAAFGVLGLEWSYEPVEVTAESLAGYLDGLDEQWRGLSLTMPLKKAVLPLVTEVDRLVEQTGVANTVLLDGESRRGFNTDVAGMVRALAGVDVTEARYAHILGGGATAASALVAVAELGAERIDVHVRDLTRSVWLEPLAHELGLMVRLRSLPQADRSLDIPDVVISTLPGGVRSGSVYTDSTRRRAVLLDVAYDPWPSALAANWAAVGGTVVSGLSMLVHQALLQVRIFVSGDPLEPLDDEPAVLAAMLDAVGIDAAGVPREI